MENLLTATKVAQHLNISVPTLTNWYKWYNDPDIVKPKNTPELPDYKQTGKRMPRYWDAKDLPKLVKFQKWIPKGRGGVMGDVNAKAWGDRGKRALKNKALQEK